MYGVSVLTMKRLGSPDLPGTVSNPTNRPALCSTASYGPCRSAWAASCFVSSMLVKSATNTASHPGHAAVASLVRSALRACSTTWWPCAIRCFAVANPRPSDDPVMKKRAV